MAAADLLAVAGTASTIEDLHPDMLTRVLRRLDGPALAALSCSNSHLRSLASQPVLWSDLCLSAWPSLHHPRLLRFFSSSPDSHRSFFSDVFPYPSPISVAAGCDDSSCLPSELISAVDLCHRGVPVLSRVVETDTSTHWFRGAPFRIDALDRKDPPPPPPPALPDFAAPAEPIISPEDLTLSWIVIDPHRRLAVTVTSRQPVAVDRHWITGETVIRFATVLSEDYALGVVVTCGEDTGHVREVSLMAEGVEGACLSGREGLAVLQAAMEGSRRREEADEVARRRWEEFTGRRQKWKEATARRERVVDLTCATVGAAAFLALFAAAALR